MKRLAPRRPSPALIIAILALVVAMAGTGYAATKLPKNSVGAKQIKKNAVTAAKIKKNAVTGAKIKKNVITGTKIKDQSLTGSDIDLAQLGTVPSAAQAASAGSANTANSANSANTANVAGVANSLSALEPVHIVGAPGEPAFQGGSNNISALGEVPFNFAPVGFYKDHEGIVHLQGAAFAGEGGELPVIFTLPPGFRPAAGTMMLSGAGSLGSPVLIAGSNTTIEGMAISGDVLAFTGGEIPALLDGITFRAAS